MEKRGRRKTAVGTVIGNSMDKSIMIKVERTFRHPLYEKIVRRSKKYMVHDEKNEAKVGDKVRIVETRPLSKRKCWRLMEILNRAEKKAE